MPEQAEALRAERTPFSSPEDINDGHHTHPSKRVVKCCPTYRKRIHGVQAIERIGLAKVAAECPHLRTWLTSLESLR